MKSWGRADNVSVDKQSPSWEQRIFSVVCVCPVQSGSCWLVDGKPALLTLWTKAWSCHVNTNHSTSLPSYEFPYVVFPFSAILSPHLTLGEVWAFPIFASSTVTERGTWQPHLEENVCFPAEAIPF